MSIKHIMGLDNSNISDSEIMNKIIQAENHNLDEVEFITEEGNIVKVSLPHLKFDEFMYREA